MEDTPFGCPLHHERAFTASDDNPCFGTGSTGARPLSDRRQHVSNREQLVGVLNVSGGGGVRYDL
jgi:hypothetical protein